MLPASPPALGAALIFICAALLCAAALHDVIARTVPNWIPVTLGLATLVPSFGAHAGRDGLLTALPVFGGVFGAALLLWRLGLLGGGDAKLLGAVSLLVPPGRIGGAVTVIGLAGGILALPYLACRGRIARPSPAKPSSLLARAWRAERFRLRRGGPVPYAVAIAAGTVYGLLGGPP